MTFWALGKVKNITEKLNLKDYKEYGTKIIKNYMTNEQADFYKNLSQLQSSDSAGKKEKFTNEEWMAIQMQQYKKLSSLQAKLLKKHQQQEREKLEKQQKELERQLKEISENQEKQIAKVQKQKMKSKIKKGETTFQAIIQENIEMREEIEKAKVMGKCR